MGCICNFYIPFRIVSFLVDWFVPDFAMLRDRAINPFNKRVYSILSFGWSGRVKDWQRFEEVSLVLAGLATPLVLSVHTICIDGLCYISNSRLAYYNFSSLLRLAGAVFSGFAMVNTLLIIMRQVSNLEAIHYSTAY